MVNGIWTYDQFEIRENIKQYFIDLYHDPMPAQPNLDGVQWDMLGVSNNLVLKGLFFANEILAALKSMEDDKAPSPDGFSRRFLISCWEVVGTKILEVFEAFHKHDQWCTSLSVTFITLIPKKKDASEAKDYKPTSLVGCLYKLLAKTLAIRLKQVMGTIILEMQNAFLPGRQILDLLTC